MAYTLPVLPAPGEDTESLHDVISEFNVEYKINGPDTDYGTLMHFHECYEFVHYVQSHNHAYIDDVSYTIDTNDVLIIPPRKIHIIHYTPGHTYARYVLYFSRAFIEPTLKALGCEDALEYFISMPYKKITLSPKLLGRVGTLFDTLCLHYQKSVAGDERGQSLVKAYTAAIIGEIYRQCTRQALSGPPRSTHSLTEQIIKYINDHYTEEISLAHLETLLYTSRYNICRVFRRETGAPLMEYVQHKRVLEAQRLLLESGRSVTEVAFECGFNNIQHFYRVFKKFTKATPLQYQKARTGEPTEQG